MCQQCTFFVRGILWQRQSRQVKRRRVAIRLLLLWLCYSISIPANKLIKFKVNWKVAYIFRFRFCFRLSVHKTCRNYARCAWAFFEIWQLNVWSIFVVTNEWLIALVNVGAGVRWASDNSTERSTEDCKRGLRLNVTLRTVDCTATHSHSPNVSTSLVCSGHGRCMASKYYDVSELIIDRCDCLRHRGRHHHYRKLMKTKSSPITEIERASMIVTNVVA